MLKRAFDLVGASLALLVLSPLMLALAIWIKLDSPGPVFFRQERVGRHGVPFRIHKFRTMRMEAGGLQLTVGADPRITRVGAFLRGNRLDELPQLIDVIRGSMSLVGPRPEVPRYVAMYPPEWRERLLSVRPGVTDFASVSYRDESERLAAASDPEREYVEVVLPSKLRYSLHYVDNPSMANDLRVLGLTLKTVVVPSLPLPRSMFTMKHDQLWSRLDEKMSALNPRNRPLSMMVDAVVILACWHFTYLFRLGFERWQPGRPWYDDYVSFGVVLAYLVAMFLTGVPRGPWRFFGFDDFKRIAAACMLAGLVSTAAVLLAQLVGVARAVLLLHPLFCLLALSLVRMVYRMVWEHARARADGMEVEARRAIVLGAGEAARRLLATIHRRDGWTVMALLDDDPAKHGLRIGGVTVQGPLTDVCFPHVLAGATHIIVAMPSADATERERAVALARQTGLTVLSVPSRLELRGESTSLSAEAGAAAGV